MAKREAGLEYMDIVMPNGKIQETLTVKLYAPDGDIFAMPQGGTTTRYVARGYGLKSSPEWEAKNKELMQAKAESLRMSELQGQIANRKKAIEAKEKLSADYAELEKLDAILEAKENALNGIVEEAPSEPVEKPKVKAKPKATAKV